MALLTVAFIVLVSALCVVGYLVWLFGWRWEVLQFAIIIAFAVLGLFVGSVVHPGSRLAEGAGMVLAVAIGFFVARWATQKLSRAIDRV